MGANWRGCRTLLAVLPILVVLVFQRADFNPIVELQNLVSSTPPLWNTNLSYVPKLHLQHIETCTEDNKYVRVCIVRNAVSSSAREAFLQMNDDSVLSLLKVNSSVSSIGSFCRAGSVDASSRSFLKKERVRHATVGELARGEAGHSYRGFASFNYSNYEPILTPIIEAGLFPSQEEPDRADIFAGDMPAAMTTAALHANQFEMSTTVQVFGEKLWNFVTPQCMFSEMKAYRIGMFIAPADTSMEVLERCTVTTAVAGPGDVIVFPKAWPHQIYSLPGPNLMVNLRSSSFSFLVPTDVWSVLAHAMVPTSDGSNMICNPDVELSPTGFNHGAPEPKNPLAKARNGKASAVDLRHCMLGRLARLDEYIEKKQSTQIPDDVEVSTLQQIQAFHGRSDT